MSTYPQDQLDWHLASKQGCAFATHIIRVSSASTELWDKLIITSDISSIDISQINQFIEKAIGLENNQMVSVVFKNLSTEAELQQLCKKFEEDDNWEVISDSYTSSIYLLLSLRYKTIHDNLIVNLWALGFGPITQFPLTRQSPYVEIILPTKTKQYLQSKHSRHSLTKHYEDSIDRKGAIDSSHLADMYINKLTNNVHRDTKFWTSTSKLKMAVLKGQTEDPRAKAKVTFSFSLQ